MYDISWYTVIVRIVITFLPDLLRRALRWGGGSSAAGENSFPCDNYTILSEFFLKLTLFSDR